MKSYVEFETTKPLAMYSWVENRNNNIYRIWIEYDSRKDTKNKRLKLFYKQVAELLEPNDNSVIKLLKV